MIVEAACIQVYTPFEKKKNYICHKVPHVSKSVDVAMAQTQRQKQEKVMENPKRVVSNLYNFRHLKKRMMPC